MSLSWKGSNAVADAISTHSLRSIAHEQLVLDISACV